MSGATNRSCSSQPMIPAVKTIRPVAEMPFE
jgi:hypothetical protein